MLSSPVTAIFGSALFSCKARSDWLIRVLQRLICAGNEACVKKRLQAPVVPLVFLRRKKTKQNKKTTTKNTNNNKRAIFRKNVTDFF